MYDISTYTIEIWAAIGLTSVWVITGFYLTFEILDWVTSQDLDDANKTQ